jgi:hypothetical protein
MAQRMNANTKATEGAAQSGPSSSLVAVLSCMQEGAVAKFRLYDSSDEVFTDDGYGEGYEFVAHYNELADGEVLFSGLNITTPGAIINVDNTQMKGSATAVFSGTPYDDEQLVILCSDDGNDGNGGVVGVAGISIQYSRDGGLTFSRSLRLGTAVSYTIAPLGVTVTFVAGTTLKTGDQASCYCTSPKPATADIGAAITALLARADKPRAILVCGDLPNQSALEGIISQASALRSGNRFTQLFANLRDYFPPAVFQGSRTFTASLSGETVTTASGGETYTRSAGSFLTDGIKVGDTVNWTGFVNSANNGEHVITALTATIMTCSASSLVTESTVANTTCETLGESVTATASTKTYTRTVGSFMTEGFQPGQTVTINGFVNADNNGTHLITAVTTDTLVVAETLTDELTPLFGVTMAATELDTTWSAALGGVVGDTLLTELIDQGVSPYGGRGRRVSPTDGSNKRRPSAWWALARWMGHDPAVAPYRVSDGELDGVTITTPDGDPEDHDERTMGGLLENRISCLESKDDRPGVFVSLALTLDEDDAVLSRVQTKGVSDIICSVVQTTTSNKLGGSPQTNTDGTLTEAAARAIEDYVRTEVEKAVLTNGPLDGLPQASSIDSVTISRTVNVLTPGNTVPTVTKWTPLGVLEQFENTVQANSGS